MTSRLGTVKSQTFFFTVKASAINVFNLKITASECIQPLAKIFSSFTIILFNMGIKFAVFYDYIKILDTGLSIKIPALKMRQINIFKFSFLSLFHLFHIFCK